VDLSVRVTDRASRLSGRLGLKLIGCRDSIQQYRHLFGVMVVEPARKHFDEGPCFGSHPAAGQVGEPPRITFTGDQGAEHVAHERSDTTLHRMLRDPYYSSSTRVRSIPVGTKPSSAKMMVSKTSSTSVATPGQRLHLDPPPQGHPVLPAATRLGAQRA
jgi:hypothetical protein